MTINIGDNNGKLCVGLGWIFRIFNFTRLCMGLMRIHQPHLTPPAVEIFPLLPQLMTTTEANEMVLNMVMVTDTVPGFSVHTANSFLGRLPSQTQQELC